MSSIPPLQVIGGGSAFSMHLQTELKHAGADVVAKEGVWQLKITQNKLNKRVMSVDADGKAQEYELSQNVSFSVVEAASRKVLSQQTFVRTRDLLFDKNEVLGKDYEERMLYEDIENDMVNTIILYLRTLAGKYRDRT